MHGQEKSPVCCPMMIAKTVLCSSTPSSSKRDEGRGSMWAEDTIRSKCYSVLRGRTVVRAGGAKLKFFIGRLFGSRRKLHIRHSMADR